MSHPVQVRKRMRPLTRMLLAAVTLAAFMVPTAAAQAHDQIETTSPTDGSTVQVMPEKIGLTFNHTPIEIGSEILINDDAGTNWAQGPVGIVDSNVSQGVKSGAPAGHYTVEWRIVSSDSHPIEGTFSFTTTSPATGTAAGSAVAPTAEATGEASAAVIAAASPTDTAAVASSDSSVPWGIIAAGAGLVLLIVVGLFVAKRVLNKTAE